MPHPQHHPSAAGASTPVILAPGVVPVLGAPLGDAVNLPQVVPGPPPNYPRPADVAPPSGAGKGQGQGLFAAYHAKFPKAENEGRSAYRARILKEMAAGKKEIPSQAKPAPQEKATGKKKGKSGKGAKGSKGKSGKGVEQARQPLPQTRSRRLLLLQ